MVCLIRRCLTHPSLYSRAVCRHKWGRTEVCSWGNWGDGSAQCWMAGNLPITQMESWMAQQTWRPASDPGQTTPFPNYAFHFWKIFSLRQSKGNTSYVHALTLSDRTNYVRWKKSFFFSKIDFFILIEKCTKSHDLWGKAIFRFHTKN